MPNSSLMQILKSVNLQSYKVAVKTMKNGNKVHCSRMLYNSISLKHMDG